MKMGNQMVKENNRFWSFYDYKNKKFVITTEENVERYKEKYGRRFMKCHEGKSLEEVKEYTSRELKDIIDEEKRERKYQYIEQITGIKHKTSIYCDPLDNDENVRNIYVDDYYVNPERETWYYTSTIKKRDEIKNFILEKESLSEDDIIYSDFDHIIFRPDDNHDFTVIQYVYYYGQTQKFVRGAYFYKIKDNSDLKKYGSTVIENQ